MLVEEMTVDEIITHVFGRVDNMVVSYRGIGEYRTHQRWVIDKPGSLNEGVGMATLLADTLVIEANDGDEAYA